MNETMTTDFVKDELPVIYMMQEASGKVSHWFHGKPRELGDLLVDPVTKLIKEQPDVRRELRRAVRRVRVNTMPDFVRYWLDGWPLTLIGVGLIYLVLYGLGFVLHWLGVM